MDGVLVCRDETDMLFPVLDEEDSGKKTGIEEAMELLEKMLGEKELPGISDTDELMALLRQLLDEDDEEDVITGLLKYALEKSIISENEYREILKGLEKDKIFCLINEKNAERMVYDLHPSGIQTETQAEGYLHFEDVKYEDSALTYWEGVRTELSGDTVRISYHNPIFYNEQWTYERLFFDNLEETNVYELTKKMSERTGTDIEIVDDPSFGKYVKSIDGKQDGDGGRYWEYWVVNRDTGEKRIGERSIDQQTLRKNEFIEWRLAEERESVCGGGGGMEPEHEVAGYFRDGMTKAKDRYVRGMNNPVYMGSLNRKLRLAY